MAAPAPSADQVAQIRQIDADIRRGGFLLSFEVPTVIAGAIMGYTSRYAWTVVQRIHAMAVKKAHILAGDAKLLVSAMESDAAGDEVGHWDLPSGAVCEVQSRSLRIFDPAPLAPAGVALLFEPIASSREA